MTTTLLFVVLTLLCLSCKNLVSGQLEKNSNFKVTPSIINKLDASGSSSVRSDSASKDSLNTEAINLTGPNPNPCFKHSCFI